MDSFSDRHIGPRAGDIASMVKALGFGSLTDLTNSAVPATIRSTAPLALSAPVSEAALLAELRDLAGKNCAYRSFIGAGYYNCFTPAVILRNILENPGWYTQYTPYQAEISQGRLEALLNFQTMIADLTALPIANASLLDEATAAAEAMTLCHSAVGEERNVFFVSDECHPQTIAVVKTRALPMGFEVVVGNHEKFEFARVFGALVQYPSTYGSVHDYGNFIRRAHAANALVVVAADLLSLALLTPPGEFGADVAIGNTQRFGVPLGFGGPHAAYLSTRDEYKRSLPGRLVGVSVDAEGHPALRLSLQTREQHIRRARATSNICTAQVLLAIISSMYACYHGPEGLRRIAKRVHGTTCALAAALRAMGHDVGPDRFFDTICITSNAETIARIHAEAAARKINLRRICERRVGVSLDETVTDGELNTLIDIFATANGKKPVAQVGRGETIPENLGRKSAFLTHPVFNSYRSETEMMRYIKRLEGRDLSLTSSMISLGSCTMKLNAAAEMLPITWPGFADLHPFVPGEQAAGYKILFERLEEMLKAITGFDTVSLQPNAGSQGEYTGLLAIRAYHSSRGQAVRNICLIPESAHGTNPASATMAGLKVVGVKCDESGNISIDELRSLAQRHAGELAALMITYPSTHGVFEEGVREICDIVHKHGGQVYLDGANMNALVGLCKPADFGADVCHLNLHKTFCIPHGGGGPGMGPIGVKSHLAKFLPSHPLVNMGGEKSLGTVSAAPWGSPSILPISYAYIRMMGSDGLKLATQVAILNANYIATRLDQYFPVLFKGAKGLVAHECIVDLRGLKSSAGIEVEDVAKRLMDYGFHAPTTSWPVAGTMMIEPTESESKSELDRFCFALISIHAEAAEIANGKADRKNNVLKNAPHTAMMIASDKWDKPYSREKAAFPAPWLREQKFWPHVARIDNPYGDRNLVCTACAPDTC